jgi:hypothetical protein
MSGDVYLFAFVVGWFASIVFAAGFGAQKNALGTGMFLGFMLGPIGMIAAGLLDGRPTCERCGGRQNMRPDGDHYPICEHCGANNAKHVED